MSALTHLSLFSGIGGIDLAAEWAGFKTVAFVERDEFCQKVLAKHWPGVPIYNDVTTFDGTGFRGVDLLSGGFPCQPHSFAGKRKASLDDRDLWAECARLIRETNCRWFLGENVLGLLSSESGRFFGRVLSDLAFMGLRVGWATYGAGHVGARHRRLRVFLVAYRPGDKEDGFQDFRDEKAIQGQPGGVLGAAISKTDWHLDTPRFLGVPHGVYTRMDEHRAHALGNAVVPQQVYPILQAIADEVLS